MDKSTQQKRATRYSIAPETEQDCKHDSLAKCRLQIYSILFIRRLISLSLFSRDHSQKISHDLLFETIFKK